LPLRILEFCFGVQHDFKFFSPSEFCFEVQHDEVFPPFIAH